MSGQHGRFRTSDIIFFVANRRIRIAGCWSRSRQQGNTCLQRCRIRKRRDVFRLTSAFGKQRPKISAVAGINSCRQTSFYMNLDARFTTNAAAAEALPNNSRHPGKSNGLLLLIKHRYFLIETLIFRSAPPSSFLPVIMDILHGLRAAENLALTLDRAASLNICHAICMPIYQQVNASLLVYVDSAVILVYSDWAAFHHENTASLSPPFCCDRGMDSSVCRI